MRREIRVKIADIKSKELVGIFDDIENILDNAGYGVETKTIVAAAQHIYLMDTDYVIVYND